MSIISSFKLTKFSLKKELLIFGAAAEKWQRKLMRMTKTRLFYYDER